MNIKDIKLENNIVLAPMADYTDSAFRSICKKFGVGLTVTEMVSAKGLIFNNEKTLELLRVDKDETTVAVQIFGSDPELMALACSHPAISNFDIIDINMGCPVPKITKLNQGSALMKNISLAEEIIKKCVKSTSKPITVKFRSGWDENNINAVEFAKMCENAGASAIFLHGRTRDQQYSGNSNLDIIKKVKESVSIPVIGNGDVIDVDSYNKMMDYTGVDGVMIGRGSIGNPFIFSEILSNNQEKNYIEVINLHIDKLVELYGSKKVAAIKLRKHMAYYLKGIKNANEYKRLIFKTECVEEIRKIVNDAFNHAIK